MWSLKIKRQKKNLKANETFLEIHTKSLIGVHNVLTLHLAGSSFKLNIQEKKVISLFNSNYPVARRKDTHIRDGATRVIGLCFLPGLGIVLLQDLQQTELFMALCPLNLLDHFICEVSRCCSYRHTPICCLSYSLLIRQGF